MKKLVVTLITLFIILGVAVVGILVTDYMADDTTSQSPGLIIVQDIIEADETLDEFGEALFTIDEGMRLDYASNPLVLDYEGMSVTLAYESHADNLKNEPSANAPVVYSEDGLTFVEKEQAGNSVKPKPLLLPDGSYRRYWYDPQEGGVVGQTSTDAETFTDLDGVFDHIEGGGNIDARTFGVSTYFVDSDGGIVLLYNSTDDDGAIVVNRAYASAENDWMEFVLEKQDILDGTLESEVYADPTSLVLENGDVWLVVMNQGEGPMPPLGRQGRIHAYVSTDGGDTFAYWGHLFSYDDVTEFDVYSLNDPKIVEHSDGTLRIYIAAMVKDEEVEAEDEKTGNKYIMISASY